MHIELSRDDAVALRDLLRERVIELDKEINRTDSIMFKQELRQLDRTIERVLGEVSAALANAPSVEHSTHDGKAGAHRAAPAAAGHELANGSNQS